MDHSMYSVSPLPNPLKQIAEFKDYMGLFCELLFLYISMCCNCGFSMIILYLSAALSSGMKSIIPLPNPLFYPKLNITNNCIICKIQFVNFSLTNNVNWCYKYTISRQILNCICNMHLFSKYAKICTYKSPFWDVDTSQ